jgi:two-component system, OmpR family, phosphate regulon response regulator OmpR
MAELAHILVVDDDTRLRELLRRYLSENGFVVSAAKDAAEARRLLAGLEFDMIVLDVMMPGEDGFALTESLRRTNPVPILLLTARGEVDDRIAGLERGADDYLSKPFEPRELLLRISTILRRAAMPGAGRGGPGEATQKIAFGACVFHLSRGELMREDQPVHLTEIETVLLRALAERAGAPVSREELILEGGIDGNERAVDVQVTRLRRKIEPNPRAPRYLQTVRGAGYRLRLD